MKIKTKTFLLSLPLLMAGLAYADTVPVPQTDTKVDQSVMGEQQKFEIQLRDERTAFNKKLMDDRKAFIDSLKDKTVDQKKSAVSEFNTKQSKARREFADAQMQKRNDFRKAHGLAPLPTAEERRKAMEQRHPSAPKQ